MNIREESLQKHYEWNGKNEVVSKEKVNLGLVLNASAKNIGINDLLSDAIVLNDVIYQGFIETISDNILNLMCRENLSWILLSKY